MIVIYANRTSWWLMVLLCCSFCSFLLLLCCFWNLTVLQKFPFTFNVKEQLWHSVKYLFFVPLNNDMNISCEIGTCVNGWLNYDRIVVFGWMSPLRHPREINVVSVPLLYTTTYKSLCVERAVSLRMAVCSGRYLWLFSFPKRAETLCYLWLTLSWRESVSGSSGVV